MSETPASPSPAPTLAAMRESIEKHIERTTAPRLVLGFSKAEARLLASALADSERLAELREALALVETGAASVLWEPTGYRVEQGKHYLRERTFSGPSGNTLHDALDAVRSAARLASGGES